MGSLLYGAPAETFTLDDRTLAHVELVIVAKLRRNESFALSISPDEGGRVTVWVSPSSTMTFKFDETEHAINRSWLEILLDSANTTSGLRVLPEPTAG